MVNDEDPTPSVTAGPFYKPKSPQRSSLLEPGIEGTKIILSGLVLTTTGKPIPNALVDFWHADANGDYDNKGYKLRGHQFTDDKGKTDFLFKPELLVRIRDTDDGKKATFNFVLEIG